MRTDLSANFISAKQSVSRKPRQLAVFHFPVAGDVYLSDQALGSADGLGNEYAPLVESWGVLTDIASGDPTDHTSLETRQLSVTLFNNSANRFSDYFSSDNPENVTVDVYQWFAGTLESDKALIDTFVIQDPIQYSEANPLLTLDLVSLNMRYDNPVGDIITTTAYPDASASAVGKGINLIFGSPGRVKTLCSRAADEATLNGSILAGTMTINTNENIDHFPASGTIQIDEERITYSAKGATSFTVSARGVSGTTAAEHITGAKILEHITNHTHIIGKGPIQSVSNILVGGQPNLAAVTAQLSADPATITFSEPPYSRSFAASPTFLEFQLDVVNATNTALLAANAFDGTQLNYSVLNEVNKKFSARQTTVMQDRGEIVKAFLMVEHYAEGQLTTDYARVQLNGATLGNLAKPSAAEVLAVSGDVDIDHGHSHGISGDHSHTFTVPGVSSSTPAHSHAANMTVNHIATGATSPDGIAGGAVASTYDQSGVTFCRLNPTGGGLDSVRQTYPAFSGGTISKIYVCVNHQTSGIAGSNVVYVDINDTAEHYQLANTGGQATTQKFLISGTAIPVVYLKAYRYDAAPDCYCYEMYLEIHLSATATQSLTITSSASGGAVNTKTGVITGGVNSLAAANEPLNINDSDITTRTFVDIFDITNTVNFNWAWFTNKDVVIDYIGTVDNKNIYLHHVFFEVEYRKREVIFSDDITVVPTGLIDDGSGTITGTPNAMITRPDHVRKYLLNKCGGMPLANIDTSSFAAAGTLFASLGYYINGVIDANSTVKEAERKIAFQTRSRLTWNHGKAKIKVRQDPTSLPVDRALTTAHFRAKSFAAQRQNVSALINTIKLAYARDWTATSSDVDGYLKVASGSNATSISRNGVLEQRDRFLFDLVTSDAMASDLLAFYLDELATASTFYTFETYLEQFDLEKEDIVTLTTAFGNLSAAKAVIRAASRDFGSGKLNKINTIKITAEVF